MPPHLFHLLISSQGLTKLSELDFNRSVVQTGLKAVILLSQPLKLLGLSVRAIRPGPFESF